MKKLLYVHLVISAVSIIVGFIPILGYNVIIALIYLALCAVSLVIPISILKMMESEEKMRSEINMLRHNFRQMERTLSLDENIEYQSALMGGESAYGTWKCVKCGSVNKLGIAYCENCKSAYSSEINPTADPNKKKRTNRWGI